MSSSDFFIKPLATGCVAVAIDQFILKNDMNRSMYIGLAAGVGASLGSTIGFIPPINFGMQTFFGNGKGASQRLTEMAVGVGAAYVINNYVLKNTSFRDNFTNQIGVIVVADLAGEYISDYISGRPLAFFE